MKKPDHLVLDTWIFFCRLGLDQSLLKMRLASKVTFQSNEFGLKLPSRLLSTFWGYVSLSSVSPLSVFKLR